MGRDIARVVGARSRRAGYLEGAAVWVSWCIGHLAELCEPHEYDPKWKRWSAELLPILPAQFRVKPSASGAKQLRILHQLMHAPEVTELVNACDAGREGELIFRYLVDLKPCAKPVKRLWISSLTPQAIRAGMARLRPSQEFDPLADAARCRAEADWLVGMNATRALTALARRGGGSGRASLLSVGRVQTPTLALICEREQAIESFVSEPYWQVYAQFSVQRDPAAAPTGRADHYRGVWQRPAESRAAPSPLAASPATAPAMAGPVAPTTPGAAAREPTESARAARERATRLDSRAAADAIAAAVTGKPGRISRVKRDTVRERPPLGFDLTDLQKTANRRLRMSAQTTLKVAQSLYETHKAITYPRTDSRYLSSDLRATIPDLLGALTSLPAPYHDLASAAQERGLDGAQRLFNDARVNDHHAIIPTAALPAMERLRPDERKIYDFIVRRFLAGFLPDAVFENTQIDTEVDTESGQHRFVSRGRVRIAEGWHRAEPPPKPREREPDLPRVATDQRVMTDCAEVRAGETQPPKRYSEASLLAAMEHAGRSVEDRELRRALADAGLGTPATRAAVIETLLARRYIERRPPTLHPTEAGRALVQAVPVAELLSAEMTGAWEQRLAAIARGQGSRAAFMDEIRAFTVRVVEATKQATPPDISAPEPDILGTCPICRKPVTEGFKSYQCATGKACSFVIFKRVAGRAISPALVRVLLSRGRSQPLRGFRSKRGKRFSAALVLDDSGRVEFAFQDRTTGSQRAGSRAPAPRRDQGEESAKAPSQRAPRCPACRHGHIIAGHHAWGCSRWRQQCQFRVSYVQNGLRVPADEADRLFRRRQTRLLDGLSPHGRARLVLDLTQPGNVRIELGKRARQHLIDP
ncbi:MAG: type IA DNA topoisomerase [Haliangiales bacterium]